MDIESVDNLTDRAHERVKRGGGAALMADRVVGPLMRASPSFFASVMLRGPQQAPYDGKFVIGPHHLLWDDLIINHPMFVAVASRGLGKCMIDGSMIYHTDGRLTPIESFTGGEILAYDPDQLNFAPAQASARFDNGVQDCLEITTALGRKTVVTANHPLRTLDAWVRAGDLIKGQRIASPGRIPLPSKAKHVPGAWLLGALLGDGSFQRCGVSFTKKDVGVMNQFRAEAMAMGWVVNETDPGKSDRYGVMLRPHKLWHRENSPLQFARSHKLHDTRSHTKKVPDAIFQADESSLCEFVSGYANTDTHIDPNLQSLEFYSVNERLLRDVQHLLLRLGVVGYLKVKNGRYRGDVHKSWRLAVRGDELDRLLSKITLHGERANAVKQFYAIRKSQSRNRQHSNFRNLPRETIDWLKQSPHWYKARGLPHAARCYSMSREKALALGEYDNNGRLVKLSQADELVWDEIVGVQAIGKRQTWGITVPGLENYVGDDLVQHNSFYFSFAVPIWGAVVSPHSSQMLIASIDDNAKRVMREIREEVEDNPLLRWLYPERNTRNAWTTHDMQLANGHWLYSRSSGTKVRGIHPGRILGDDILTDEAKYSEVYRRKMADWWHSVVEPMPLKGGQTGAIGTTLNKNDLLYGDLRKNGEYTYRVFTAMDEQGNANWPEHMDCEQIESKRRSMGPIRFDTEMRCVPVSDDTSICPRRLFEQKGQLVHSATLGMPRAHWEAMGCTLFIGVDFAFSAAASADYFVIFVIAVDKDGNHWWVDIFRDKGMSYQRQQDVMKDYGYRYLPELMYLEANQAQQIMGDEMIRSTDLNIRKFVTTAAKHKFEAGIPRLALLAENGKWRIPRGDARSQQMTDWVLDELSSMTFNADTGKIISVGEHDDGPMSLWIASKAAQASSGYGVYFDDPEDATQNPAQGSTAAVTPASDGLSQPPRVPPSPGAAPEPLVGANGQVVANSQRDLLGQLGHFPF